MWFPMPLVYLCFLPNHLLRLKYVFWGFLDGIKRKNDSFEKLRGGSEEIYFKKTREYFKEVVSSYSNENYRSAIVMLYSISICDILFKLQELKDMYNDSMAAKILKKVEDLRNNQNKRLEK